MAGVTNLNEPTDSWRIATPPTDGNQEIEGFASATSVNRGDSIIFYVNTVAPTYHIDLFRMGWYTAEGLGGLLVGHIDALPGVKQPAFTVDERGMIECPWSESYTLDVPAEWSSGVYLAKLTTDQLATEFASYIIFVVRDDSSTSALLFQCSVNTYQAYNDWGKKNLYSDYNFATPDDQDIHRSRAVSLNRPYHRGFGAGDFFLYEYPMLRWLEHNGYDVTYTTDVDTDASPDLLRNHMAFLVVGHDEYWSYGMRDAVETALVRGVSLGFFGANAIYWQVRYEASFNRDRGCSYATRARATRTLQKTQNPLGSQRTRSSAWTIAV